MTSALPGQAGAKAPLNIFITHFILYFITSRQGWKNTPIAWETCGKGNDGLQRGLGIVVPPKPPATECGFPSAGSI